MDLPGGGSVLIAEPYNRKLSYPTYAERNEVSSDMLIAYRNWRSTMSGHPECDGVIAVGRIERFGTLKDFVLKARGALSIQWSAADTVPGTAWTSAERRYPLEEREGESGPELVQALAVHRSGWLDVYDDPALLYAAGNRNGLNIAIWITNKQGGARRALQHANRIAASFQR